jgi:hypothetical protein
MKTHPTISDEQIEALRREAAAAGDEAQEALCRRALGDRTRMDALGEIWRGPGLISGEHYVSPEEARILCAYAIADAAAQEVR